MGGPAYIASLVDGVPRATNVEYYAKIVKEKAVLRSLIARGEHDPARRLRGRPGRRRDPRPRRALDLPDRRGAASGPGFVSLYDIAQRERRGDPEGARGEEADHRRADRLQRPRQPDVRLPARRPDHRRGAAVDGQDVAGAEHRAARRAPRPSKTVGVFSLEMSKEQLFLRMLSSRGRRSTATACARATCASDDWGRLTEALGDARAGEDLHRRHAGHRRAGDAGQVAAPGGRARPRTCSSSTTSS